MRLIIEATISHNALVTRFLHKEHSSVNCTAASNVDQEGRDQLSGSITSN